MSDRTRAPEVAAVDELPRLDELRRYEVLEGGQDPVLDRLAELAARVCHAPMGLISFIDETHQRFLARFGLPPELGEGIPRTESICAQAIGRSAGVSVLCDVPSDPTVGHFPLVAGLRLAFYAGAPLLTPRGHALGTVCVGDTRTRTLDEAETRGLQLVRDEIMELLEARRELGELRRSESLRQEAVEALLATQSDLQQRIVLRTAQIEAAHEKTRQILQRIGDAYSVLDRQARFVYVNPRAAAIFGHSAEELIGKEIWTQFPGGGGVLRGPYERAVRDGKPATVEVRYAPWDRWFEGRIYPSPEGVAMVFTEITDRKRAEDEVERSRRRLVEAQRVAHVGSWEWDVARDEVVWSDELYRVYGLPIGSALGGYQGFLGRVHPDDLARTQETVRAAYEKGGATFIYDHRIIRPDGSIRMLHTRGESIAVDGKVARLVGCCWDVTELDEATRTAARTAATLEAALAVASDGLIVVDATGRATVHNAQVATLFGLPPDASAADLWRAIPTLLVDPTQLDGIARSLGRHDGSVDTLLLRDGRRVEAASRPEIVRGATTGRVWSFRPAPATT